jgi:hypothetical protein
MLPLPKEPEIVELECLSPEMIPETYLEKFTSVDVRCKDKQRKLFASSNRVSSSLRGCAFKG